MPDIFTNDQLASEDIPTANTITFEPLHPKFARLLIIEWLLVWAGPTIAWIVLYGTGTIESSLLTGIWPLALPLVFLPLILALCPVAARHRGYALREYDIHYKSGVIWKRQVALPFNRIQHAEIERGPLERMLGLSTLKCFTAGGSQADMKIPALGMTQANRLKAFILARTGDADDRA